MVKKKRLPNFNFTNPEKIETFVPHWERIIDLVRLGRFTVRPNPTEVTPLLRLVPELTETRQLYNVLENEDGWYTDGTYESTFITIDMQNFNFLPKRKTRRD
jgi:hypothetical protein